MIPNSDNIGLFLQRAVHVSHPRHAFRVQFVTVILRMRNYLVQATTNKHWRREYVMSTPADPLTLPRPADIELPDPEGIRELKRTKASPVTSFPRCQGRTATRELRLRPCFTVALVTTPRGPLHQMTLMVQSRTSRLTRSCSRRLGKWVSSRKQSTETARKSRVQAVLCGSRGVCSGHDLAGRVSLKASPIADWTVRSSISIAEISNVWVRKPDSIEHDTSLRQLGDLRLQWAGERGCGS